MEMRILEKTAAGNTLIPIETKLYSDRTISIENEIECVKKSL
jgi:hypothetical protein